MKYLKNEKGVTLVELLVTLGIMGIVLSAIFTFFLFNYRSFIRSEDQVEAQYQAQIAMNELIENVIGAEGIAIAELQNTGENKYLVKTIVFKIYEESEDEDSFIKVEYKNQRLYRTDKVNISASEDIKNKYKGDTFTTNQYAIGIEDFQIQLIGTEDYKKSKGIKLFITSNMNNEEVSLENQIYFRNWKE